MFGETERFSAEIGSLGMGEGDFNESEDVVGKQRHRECNRNKEFPYSVI